MRKFYIYGIYDKQEPNYILYIGQHVYNDINDKYMGSGKNLLEYYKMFGKENFDKIILESEIDLKDVGSKEKEYIKKYKDLGEAELNILRGSNTTLSPKYLKLDGESLDEYKKRLKKEYNKKNLEKVRVQNKIRIERWLKTNKEYKKEQDKEYRLKHLEKISDRLKKFRTEHKEELSQYAKDYYNSHKDELKKYKQQFHIATKLIKKCPLLYKYYSNLKSNSEKTNFRTEVLVFIRKGNYDN